MNQSFGLKKDPLLFGVLLYLLLFLPSPLYIKYTHFYRLRSVLYQKTFKVALTLLPKYVNVI